MTGFRKTFHLASFLAWTLFFEQTPAGAREDVYAIYSALLSTSDELVLIESKTIRFAAPTSGCTKAPPAEVTDLAEIQADYEARKNETPLHGQHDHHGLRNTAGMRFGSPAAGGLKASRANLRRRCGAVAHFRCRRGP